MIVLAATVTCALPGDTDVAGTVEARVQATITAVAAAPTLTRTVLPTPTPSPAPTATATHTPVPTPVPVYVPELGDVYIALGDRAQPRYTRDCWVEWFDEVATVFYIAVALGDRAGTRDAFVSLIQETNCITAIGKVAADQARRIHAYSIGATFPTPRSAGLAIPTQTPYPPPWVAVVARPSNTQDAEITCRLVRVAATTRFSVLTMRAFGMAGVTEDHPAMVPAFCQKEYATYQAETYRASGSTDISYLRWLMDRYALSAP